MQVIFLYFVSGIRSHDFKAGQAVGHIYLNFHNLALQAVEGSAFHYGDHMFLL
jgi:hypothetical protein